MPEYQNMKRLDHFANRLSDWCQSRIRSPQGYDLLRQLFIYDPEHRLSAKDALHHKWFQEEPKPTWKCVDRLFEYYLHIDTLQCFCNGCAAPDSPSPKDNPGRSTFYDARTPEHYTSSRSCSYGSSFWAAAFKARKFRELRQFEWRRALRWTCFR